MNKFTTEKQILIEPIKDDNGIFYSRHYKQYGKKQINIFKYIIEHSEHVRKDNLKDMFKILSRKMMPNQMMLKNIEIADGKIMNGKTMIFYTFTMNNIEESYPIVRTQNE